MAVDLKLIVQSVYNQISIADDTGSYVVVDNEGGYGAPNVAVADIVSATLTFEIPNISTPVVIDVYPDLPNIDNTIFFDVSNTDLNLDKIPAGIYKITYLLTDNMSNTYSVEVFYYHTEPLDCCLLKKLNALTEKTPLDEVREVYRLRTLLVASKAKAAVGDFVKASYLSDYLVNQCDCCC